MQIEYFHFFQQTKTWKTYWTFTAEPKSSSRKKWKFSKISIFPKKNQISFVDEILPFKRLTHCSVATISIHKKTYVNLRMTREFFLLFFETYFCKTKKSDIQKNEHFPTSIKTRIKKCQYTLMQKKITFLENLPYQPSFAISPYSP